MTPENAICRNCWRSYGSHSARDGSCPTAKGYSQSLRFTQDTPLTFEQKLEAAADAKWKELHGQPMGEPEKAVKDIFKAGAEWAKNLR